MIVPAVWHVKTYLFLGAFTWITVKASKWTYSVYNVSNFFFLIVFLGLFFFPLMSIYFSLSFKDSDGKYFTFPLASHRKSSSHVYCENSMLVRKYYFNVWSLFIKLCWFSLDLLQF